MISFGQKTTKNEKASSLQQQPKIRIVNPHTPTPGSGPISFASKRKLNLSNDEKTEAKLAPPPASKRIKFESKIKPSQIIKPKSNYDSLCVRLTQVIDEWIFLANQSLIEKFIHDLRSSTRISDVFCVIGPSGSGKSVLIQHIAKLLRYRSVVYDEFADTGNVGEGGERKRAHPCDGFLSVLTEDRDPFIFVVDGPDGSGGNDSIHKDFINLMIHDHKQYQSYARQNKFIVLLVQSLDSYLLRNWIREIKAYKYYMSTSLKYQEQEFLRQRINSKCPLRSIEPIQACIGDYRRMGIDLVTCTHESVQRNSNALGSAFIVDRVPSIFEITRHLVTWPLEPLFRRLICGDNVDQLLNMCSQNQWQRISLVPCKFDELVSLKERNPYRFHELLKTIQGEERKNMIMTARVNLGVFDELSQVSAELSDIATIENFGDGNEVDKSLFITPITRGTPLIDTPRYDIMSLVFCMYASNLRLGRHLQKSRVEFAPSLRRSGWVCLRDLDNLDFLQDQKQSM